ncbi:hypothetical protein EX30DRAFT_320090 [Ascodesmis nigricans]|uniref:Altered inheritance of mitochondria protein 6 n=1 Tax=Ascodesmis nigricans TaxID=341454 RepID=A0A4S2MVB5_9PEZI|nr:hypothetical protein EX30DRAFT_320090 [Ascodesmis nigricans]
MQAVIGGAPRAAPRTRTSDFGNGGELRVGEGDADGVNTGYIEMGEGTSRREVDTRPTTTTAAAAVLDIETITGHGDLRQGTTASRFLLLEQQRIPDLERQGRSELYAGEVTTLESTTGNFYDDKDDSKLIDKLIDDDDAGTTTTGEKTYDPPETRNSELEPTLTFPSRPPTSSSPSPAAGAADCSVAANSERAISPRNHADHGAHDNHNTLIVASSQPSSSNEFSTLSILRLLVVLVAVHYSFTQTFGTVEGSKLASGTVMLVGRPQWWRSSRRRSSGSDLDDDDFSSTSSKRYSRSPSSSIWKTSKWTHMVLSVLFLVLFIGCTAKVISLLLSSPESWAADIPTVIRTWDLDPSIFFKTEYPTSFTRDIHPRPVHSHNDYWRQIPLFMALTVGAMGVEADVWVFEDELYVGHDAPSLSRNRTFRGLYVDPLRKLLDRMNSVPEIEVRDTEDTGKEKTLRGVYDSAPSQTLHLYIDLKTPGATTLPVVLSHLAPLRTPTNYLTYFNGTHVVPGPITIHLTGSTPFDLFLASSPSTHRDYFFDAPLDELDSGLYNSTTCIMASGAFYKSVGKVKWGVGGGVTEEMKRKVRSQVGAAHERGIGIRYWGTPGWPVSTRNEVWRVLVREGVDLLNADDIRAAVMLEW